MAWTHKALPGGGPAWGCFYMFQGEGRAAAESSTWEAGANGEWPRTSSPSATLRSRSTKVRPASRTSCPMRAGSSILASLTGRRTEDGWFSEDLGVVGEIPAEGESPDGYEAKVVRLTAHDGKLNIWIDDNGDPWSANQLERLAALLPDVLIRAWAYQPKPWMLDPEELRRHKQEAYGSCPVVIPVPPGDQNDPQEGP
jgi:hypothetical protein